LRTLQRFNNGAFLVYDISNNNITGAASMGQVGTDGEFVCTLTGNGVLRYAYCPTADALRPTRRAKT